MARLVRVRQPEEPAVGITWCCLCGEDVTHGWVDRLREDGFEPMAKAVIRSLLRFRQEPPCLTILDQSRMFSVVNLRDGLACDHCLPSIKPTGPWWE
jgi:hypothetical protein